MGTASDALLRGEAYAIGVVLLAFVVLWLVGPSVLRWLLDVKVKSDDAGDWRTLSMAFGLVVFLAMLVFLLTS